MFALDSNSLSYAMRGEGRVGDRMRQMGPAALALPAVVVYEMLESAGTPIGLADLLIAATTRRHGCTLVTHNTREFSRVPGLLVEDWY